MISLTRSTSRLTLRATVRLFWMIGVIWKVVPIWMVLIWVVMMGGSGLVAVADGCWVTVEVV
ncbi:MAG: hypothetical protein BWY73_01136 [candidate division TA06 bacterium ADurb.Bin417]|uniref:Uncharacterized protein n=1 Tax=candidate division TA06 bacterium ADurb.Bin417 TaxID=1852828 RepID=A0A1V5MDD3_UNCT6|nr:MAG: hypothetical protein BWY73_01136 [candidate division TA06 bacterium ADurb.Bin417]